MSGNACYHSVQDLLSSSVLSKNIKIKIRRTIILPGVCVGVKLGRSHWGMYAGWRCLRRIFGPKMIEVTVKWRKLQNEELNDLYSPPNIIRVIKSRRMWCSGNVACMERGEVPTGFWYWNPIERDHLEDQGVDGRIILRWIFKKWDGQDWSRLG